MQTIKQVLMHFQKNIASAIESILLILLALLFCLLPSVEIAGLWDFTQTGKFIVFSYVVLALSVLTVFQWLFFFNPRVSIHWVDVLLAVLLLYITLNRYYLQPVSGFSLRYNELLGLAALYVIVRRVKPIYYPYLLFAVMVGGILQAVYGNLQLLGHYTSHHSTFMITGSFFNPGPYAGYLASVFPIALGYYLFKSPARDLPRLCTANDWKQMKANPAVFFKKLILHLRNDNKIRYTFNN